MSFPNEILVVSTKFILSRRVPEACCFHKFWIRWYIVFVLLSQLFLKFLHTSVWITYPWCVCGDISHLQSRMSIMRSLYSGDSQFYIYAWILRVLWLKLRKQSLELDQIFIQFWRVLKVLNLCVCHVHIPIILISTWKCQTSFRNDRAY